MNKPKAAFTNTKSMKIVVASGKGGTGKTSVAINLALSTGANQYLDCDVEEPNAHIFLNGRETSQIPVEILVPVIDKSKCTFCGECSRFCQYNALFVVGDTAMVFPELCHSCGGCSIVCPEGAISEVPRNIATIHKLQINDMELVYGNLNVGEPLAVPVISAVKDQTFSEGLVILDAPPGTACPVVESISNADVCIMVTEPTPFGLHDLEIASEVVKQLDVPVGVVINFAGIGDQAVYAFCEKQGIPILMEIPFDRRIAELYSTGIPFSTEMTEWQPKFQELLEKTKALIK